MTALSDRRNPRFEEVRAAVVAARRLRREVVVATVVLAELYRAPFRNALVDACLGRETGLVVRVTDRPFARLVGGILNAAGAGSDDMADAHCIAAAVESGGGVVLTGDPLDLERLAASYANIHVEGL